MTSLAFPDGDKPGSLPLLTELADGGDELPTLTEAITVADVPIPANELPILLEPADVADLHFDRAAPAITDEFAVPLPPLLSEAQIQRLEQQLAAHLEKLLKDKLILRLEQLQKLALDQALGELKAELPVLLRDVLDDHLKPR